MSLCVYALTGGSALPTLRRGGQGPLRAIRVGRVQAIVGPAAGAPPATEKNLRAYDRLLTAVWRQAPAVIPVRFGTVLDGVPEIEQLLAQRHDELVRQLAAVRRRAQMTVRVVGGPTRRPSAGERRPRSGREYLRSRGTAAQLATSSPALARLRPSVARWVRGERVEQRANVTTLYHLVPRTAADRYARALRRAAGGASVQVVVSGPFPPYAFADAW